MSLAKATRAELVVTDSDAGVGAKNAVGGAGGTCWATAGDANNRNAANA